MARDDYSYLLDDSGSLPDLVGRAPAAPLPERGLVDRVTGNYDTWIGQAAQEHGIDPRLLKGLIRTESNGSRDVVSNKGAIGMGQVMPDTARRYGVDPSQLTDPAVNINLSARILADNLKAARGDVRKALTYYIGGMDPKNWGQQTHEYPDKVIANAMRYNAEGESDFMRGLKGGLQGTVADWQNRQALGALRQDDFNAATEYAMRARERQQKIQDYARTQDQLSEVTNPSEFVDWLQNTGGQALGSTAPALGYAAGGAAIGSMVPGLGTAVGGLAGLGYGLAHQYMGNTLGGALNQKLKQEPQEQPVTADTIRKNLISFSPEDIQRIEQAGVARGLVETGADLALGGLAKIVPLGKAVDLLGLTKPLGRSLTGGASEALTEMADVPLEAYGTGGDYSPKDLLNSGAAGFVGGHGLTTAANPLGAIAQTRGFTNPEYRPDYGAYAYDQFQGGAPAVTPEEYNQQFYENSKLRNATRAAIRQQALPLTPAAQEQIAQEQAAQEQVDAGPPSLPTFKELKAQMLAEHEAKVAAAKPPKVTQEELDTAVEKFLADNPDAETVPAHLNTLKAYQKYQAETHKAENTAPKLPTNQDIYAALKRMRDERAHYYGPQPEQPGPQPFMGPLAPAQVEAPAEAPVEAQITPEQKERDYTQLQYEHQMSLAKEPWTYTAEPELNLRPTEKRPYKENPKTRESLAAINAQSKAEQKVNTLAGKFEEQKAAMKDKAVAALRKAGALIEDGDELNWTGTRWELFPANHGRGRPRQDGTFYADVYNQAGDKIGKVKRQERAAFNENTTPLEAAPEAAKTAEPTPSAASAVLQPAGISASTQETPDAQTTESPMQGREGNASPAPQPRRRGTRRVSQPEAQDAAQREEVTHAQQKPKTGKNYGRRRARSQVREENGNPAVSGEGLQQSRPAEADAARSEGPVVDTDAERLIRKIEELQAKKKAQPDAEHKRLTEDAVAAARGDYAASEPEATDAGLDFNNDVVSYEDLLDNFDTGGAEWFSAKPSAKKAQGVARSAAQAAVDRLQKDVGDRLGIRFKVYDTPEQAFGPDSDTPAGTKGFYHSGANVVGVFRRAVDSVQDLAETLSHETFGHFGLNTLLPAEKAKFLDAIVGSQDNAEVKAAFDAVKKDQPQLDTDNKIAEEVFARAAERVDDPFWTRVWDALKAKLAPLLRALKLVGGKITHAELRQRARQIAKGIREEQVRQQTFPKDAQSQYRTGIKESFKAYQDQHFGEFESPLHQVTDTLKDIVVSLNGLPFLADWRRDLKSLQTIHKLEQAMQLSYNQKADSVVEQVENIRQLSKESKDALFRLMVAATTSRIHPDHSLSSEANAHVKKEQAQEYHKLAAQYRMLEPKAQKAYREVRDAFEAMRQQRKQALFDLADKLLSPRKAKDIKFAINALDRASPGPYFPLTRFGDYIAVWKSKDFVQAQREGDTKLESQLKGDDRHYRVSFMNSREAAQRQTNAWAQEMGDQTGSTDAKERVDFIGGMNSALTPLLTKMQDGLEVTLSKTDATKADINGARDALAQAFIAALPDTSIFISALKRENVAGVKPAEMLRAIARHGGSQAFHISRLEYAHDIQEALSRLREEDNQAMREGAKQSVMGPLARALNGLYTQDPSTGAVKVSHALQSALFFGRLALRPAFWVVSAMSPALVSIPYMTGRHNLTSAYKAWGDAALDALGILKFRSLKEYTRFSFTNAIKDSGLAPDEITALEKVEDAGGIDQSQIRELADIARSGVGTADEVKRFLGGMVHRAEVMSRISTALTAYRLEKERTGDPEKAAQYAVEVVNNTLVNYTHAHTPLILRKGGMLGGPVAKTVFQFARYQIGMGNLILHNYR